MKLKYNSPVVLTYFFASALALALSYVIPEATYIKIFSVYEASFADPMAYVRLFMHILGYFKDYTAFISTMLMLLVIGPPLEEKYGSKSIVLAILFTAVTVGLYQMLFVDTPLSGAAVIMFMMIVLASNAGASTGHIPLSLILVILLFVAEGYIDIVINDSATPFSRILGAVCGVLMAIYFTRRQKKQAARK
ncbi:MAG: rhomboid family intramembrane serine protease [Ruminococcaceae bacterium]|nr:rhomboid family intramembrane serine protease [Oscillospiraceae bacterium]